jgi:NAD(P)-dependent dehydrogenase (short-subunit alcohol dehydrogenase family)
MMRHAPEATAVRRALAERRVIGAPHEEELQVRRGPAALTGAMERQCRPERAAQLVVFLASGDGDWLSGRCLSVSDDVAELGRRTEEIQRHDLYVLRLRE